jgi:gliding motility-associated-like protein
MTYKSDYTITGLEGFAILLFPGTFTCLTIFSDTDEYYTNITWGLEPPLFPVKITENEKVCGSVTLTASGGSTYKWNAGKTPDNATNTFDKSGVYSVIATDQNGCTSKSLKIVNVPPKSAKTNINQTICQGETYAGYKTAGVYIDTLKTVSGCDSIRTLNLTVVPLPQISFPTANEVCNGKALDITPALLPANLPVTYKWSTGETTAKISVTKPGPYELTVQNGTCTAKASVTVTSGKPPALKPNETVCLISPTLQLEAGATENNVSYLWTPTNSTGSTINVTQTGNYQVKVTSPIGCDATRIITVSAAPQLELGSDKAICEGESVELLPTVTGSGTLTYRWSSGETAKTLKVSKSGLYKLTVTQASCAVTDSVKVTANPLPVVAADEITCSDKPLIAGDFDSNLTYLWEPSGEKTRTVSIREDGIYKVKITNQFGCSKTRTFTVNGPCTTRIFAPDIFTPNGDGENDVFKLFILGGIQVRLDIYNRWGSAIYSEENAVPQWDGNFKGEACPSDNYPYVLKYKLLNNDSVYEFRGVVMVQR